MKLFAGVILLVCCLVDCLEVCQMVTVNLLESFWKAGKY